MYSDLHVCMYTYIPSLKKVIILKLILSVDLFLYKQNDLGN